MLMRRRVDASRIGEEMSYVLILVSVRKPRYYKDITASVKSRQAAQPSNHKIGGGPNAGMCWKSVQFWGMRVIVPYRDEDDLGLGLSCWIAKMSESCECFQPRRPNG